MCCSRCLPVLAAVLFACAMVSNADDKPKPGIAVFEFEDLSAPAQSDNPAWQKLFALLFARSLEATEQFQVTDRWRMQEKIDSLTLASLGMVDPAGVAKLFNAEYMLLGDFNQIEPGIFIINVRLMRASDSQLVPKGTDNRQLPARDLSAFIAGSTIKVTAALKLPLSKASHKQINSVGTRSEEALALTGNALVMRNQKDYAGALTVLDSAKQADKNFAEIERQIEEVSALLELQKRLTTPEQK